MKLLAQSDDYGITPAVSKGIIDAIDNGIIRNTGMFTNMPYRKQCAEWIKPYMHKIALGIDLNASTGSSLLPHAQIPSLTHENGTFLTSKENRALDTEDNAFDHVVYEEVYAEFEAQIQEYIALFAKTPDYMHAHAYTTKTTIRASLDLAKKYHCIYTSQVPNIPDMQCAKLGWYIYGGGPEKQLTQDLKSYILSDHDHLLEHSYGYLITHCGYADAPLFDLSSFSLCRVKDLEAITSLEVKDWVKTNGVELITFKDLPYSYKDLASCNTLPF